MATTYRYFLTGDFSVGEVGGALLPKGSFGGPMFANVATGSRSFTVAGHRGGRHQSCSTAPAIGRDAINANGYLEVTFRAAGGQHA